MQRLLLKAHRWLALAAGLPLVIIVLTGLVLSFEPSVHLLSRAPSSLRASVVLEILDRHDSKRAARAITYRNYEDTLEVFVSGSSKPILVDVASGSLRERHGMLASTFLAARKLHVALVYDLRWLVTASTIALVMLALLGVLMGWPRLANTLSGWHKGVMWIGLPLVLLAPATGLLMTFGVTFGGGGAAPRSIGMPQAAMSIRDVVEAAGKSRDLSGMVWIRRMGARHMLRYTENGRFQGYFVVPQSVVPVPRNLPRAIHEGLWSVPLGLVVNVAASLVIVAGMATGLMLWLRRRRRAARKRAQHA
ncbi:MAG: PepSY-associated TM helix domain-containing protein [Hyphomicrobiaceae bacterium]